MVELIELIGKLIDVRTDLVRCSLLVYCVDHVVELQHLEHQRLLIDVHRRKDLKAFQASAVLLILVQDGFDPDDRIEDIRSRVSLKGGKSVHIKNVIL